MNQLPTASNNRHTSVTHLCVLPTKKSMTTALSLSFQRDRQQRFCSPSSWVVAAAAALTETTVTRPRQRRQSGRLQSERRAGKVVVLDTGLVRRPPPAALSAHIVNYGAVSSSAADGAAATERGHWPWWVRGRCQAVWENWAENGGRVGELGRNGGRVGELGRNGGRVGGLGRTGGRVGEQE